MRAKVIRLLVVFVAYVALARVGLAVSAVSGFATLIWAPTGISLAAMLAWGFEVWPAVALAAVLVNVHMGAPVPVALLIAAGNTAEALAGAWMLRAVRFDPRLQRLFDVLCLILLGAAASTLISASVGVLALRLGGITSTATSGRAWRTWWVGDLMGALVVTPAILVWWSRPPAKKRRHLAAEAALAVFAVLLTVFGVFGTRRQVFQLGVPAYVLFPVLLVVATRLGQYGAASANLVVTVAAISFTALGYGPFVRSAGLAENLLQLQILMGVLATTTLVLGAAVVERDCAVEAREEFLSVASHELRTPLTSLSLHLQLLARALERGAAPEPARLLAASTAALRQSRKLARLIGALLDVSRINAGRLQLEVEELDLGTLAREVVASYGEQSRRDGFSISVSCEGDCKGFWDPERLEQVVENLVSNAVKYGDGKPIEVTVRGAAGAVVLTVRDQGIGVAAEDQHQIFERFVRGASARRFGGLGLGLWITRGIVEAHQGSIRVESAPEAGAAFIVELQREPPGGVSESSGRSPSAPTEPGGARDARLGSR